MDQYRINDLERLTGIKAHTIRIWEKRYLLITPSRTATNRRYYNDAQLRKLMNISTLLAHGFKISSVAALTDNELSAQIEQLHQDPSKDVICAAYIHDLTVAMVALDEAEFEKVYTAAVDRFGFYESMLLVFYPFLRKTGQLWRIEKAMPVQEHFAYCIIRRKIILATGGLPAPARTDKKFMLFLPPNEWHETGLLFADYIIRSKGHATVYLGQNVPYDDINRTAGLVNATYLLTFFISPKPKEEIEREIADLSKKNQIRHLLISGDRDLLDGVRLPEKKTVLLMDVESLLDLL